jgi:hypothetical protein
MKTTNLLKMVLMLALPAAFPAQAHYLWIEPANGEAHLCFGEYENALREKSGGRLDTIAMPEVRTNDDQRLAVAVERKTDYMALAAKAGQPLVAQEITMKVKDLRKHNIGIVKPMYYTRFAAADVEGASLLALDIQPLGKGRVRVSLDGKPLAKAKLNVFAPNQWLREYETDEKGEATVDTPWPGLYVLEVVHVEASPGEYQGDSYEAIRHVGTLSFVR